MCLCTIASCDTDKHGKKCHQQKIMKYVRCIGIVETDNIIKMSLQHSLVIDHFHNTTCGK